MKYIRKIDESVNEMYRGTQLANMLLDDIRDGKRKGIETPTADEIQKLAPRLGMKKIQKRDVQEVIDDWDFMVNQAKGETARNKMFGVTAKIFESEEVNEAKKFKPGDMWSNDFDYDGMLKYALKVNEKTPIKTLNALFDSATDVNYHTPFRNLGIAIDWIEDGDKKGAKDYIKMFHKDIKDEIKSQS